jgi:hypothetical protein
MISKIRLALIAALVAVSASAAVARTQPAPQSQTGYGVVTTDEGYGRTGVADGSGA